MKLKIDIILPIFWQNILAIYNKYFFFNFLNLFLKGSIKHNILTFFHLFRASIYDTFFPLGLYFFSVNNYFSINTHFAEYPKKQVTLPKIKLYTVTKLHYAVMGLSLAEVQYYIVQENAAFIHFYVLKTNKSFLRLMKMEWNDINMYFSFYWFTLLLVYGKMLHTCWVLFIFIEEINYK